MSGFCVFGMTEPMARKLARDAADKRILSREEAAGMTREKEEAWIAEKAAWILEQGNTRQVSPAFDAPQFAEEWITLAKRTAKANRCRIMVRGKKIDDHGAVVVNKRTGMPTMTWLPYETNGFVRKAA